MDHDRTPQPLDLRSRAKRHDALLRSRLDTIVPMLMDRHGIDAWVLVAREYNEDPVLRTMLPATWFSARRRTILVFTARGRRRHAVSRYAVADLFPRAWDPQTIDDQWRAVADLLSRADPAEIAVNTSTAFALGDGLSHTEHLSLLSALPAKLRHRIVQAEPLAIGWLETRLDAEVANLADACAIAHSILHRGLSAHAITPGSTTTLDLEWWFREEVARASLEAWFQPTVSVQRRGESGRDDFSEHPTGVVISPGELVHVDFGIVHLGMHTDQQQHAYVLLPGETAAPEGLRRGIEAGNRAQELLMAEFRTGRTGNAVLRAALAACDDAGIDATIYTHPLGLHGHAAGPTIGLWDRQDGVPGPGDYPIYPDTAYSIELSVAVDVPEWRGQRVRIMLEEDAFFDGTTIRFVDGRQTELWLVP